MSAHRNGKPAAPAQTLTALNRWSVANKQLPAIGDIKSIHVYDFDNTLFNSPLPNTKLWHGSAIGLLQSQKLFSTGGWWHDARILAATGEGVEKEEARAWEGWWNENIVKLIELSMRQKDALTVLLTGRSESGFADLIKKMVGSKKLNFDLICLKPVVGPNRERFSSTMNFKQIFLECLIETYKKAEEIRIYEDRVKHTKAFRDFFVEYNKNQATNQTRGSIVAEVVQVVDGITQLDPVVETAEVQRLINDHNHALSQGKNGKRLQISKTVFYTGYLISNADTQKLITLAKIPPSIPEAELKFLANNVLITPRLPSKSILQKIGGLGNKVTWEVTGSAVLENKIWAACVRPVPETKKYYTENPIPMVVLALRKGARPVDAGKIQNWQPVPAEKQFVFETVVGEKVLLRIEEEDSRENEHEASLSEKKLKRKHALEEDTPTRDRTQPHGNQSVTNRYIQAHGGGRGARGSSRGTPTVQRGYRGGSISRAGRGRGRGGGPTYIYRSLDDVDHKDTNVQSSYNAAVTYEDFPPLQKQYQTPQQLVNQQFQQYQQYQQQQVQGKSGNGNTKGNSELHYS
ncbi:hypothetical protein K3495_g6564 [Podosphaera aphanis]|nr:hypothetical protein K3495_g6564 [Podosphaera aphanis]